VSVALSLPLFSAHNVKTQRWREILYEQLATEFMVLLQLIIVYVEAIRPVDQMAQTQKRISFYQANHHA
jgi:hypothetical protein